jgi:hypothetical protein
MQNFYYSDNNSSYMLMLVLRLRKIDNIRLHISEVQNGELHISSLTYTEERLMDEISVLNTVYRNIIHRKYCII